MLMNNNTKQNAESSFQAKLGALLIRNKKLMIKTVSVLITAIIWFLIWHLASLKIGLSFILPSPLAVFEKLGQIIIRSEFMFVVWGSMLRVISGFASAVICGILFAFLSHFFMPLKVFLAPLMKVVRATPVASFILIAVLWMKNDTVPIFISFLMVLPIVYGNVLTALENTDGRLIEMTNMYGFSFFKKLRVLYLPTVYPYLGSACFTSMGLAWKSGIAAEVLCVTLKSVGYYIYTSKLYMETEELFAWTVTVILLSVLIEAIMKLAAVLISRAVGGRYNAAK